MAKIKDCEDCRTGRDYVNYYQNRDGVQVTKKGSYVEIKSEKTNLNAYVPDTDRTLPKTTRASIVAALVRAGLVGMVVIAVLTAISFVI